MGGGSPGCSVPAATGQAGSVTRIALRLVGDHGDAVHRPAGLLALPRDVSRPGVLRGRHMLLREIDDVPVHPGGEASCDRKEDHEENKPGKR